MAIGRELGQNIVFSGIFNAANLCMVLNLLKSNPTSSSGRRSTNIGCKIGWPQIISVGIGMLTLMYPPAVYFGLQYFEPRILAVLLCALLLLRLAAANSPWTRPLLIVGLCYGAFAVWSNQSVALRFYPVVVNAAMLLLFSTSLMFPPTIVERLARLQEPDLPPDGVIYTRRVTQIWCGFFVLNGGIALSTALWSSFEIWSLYNGLIAYLLMGLLYGCEYLVRMRRKRQG